MGVHLKSYICDMNSLLVICMVVLFCCLHSEANNCTSQPALCPYDFLGFGHYCYCYDGRRRTFFCQGNGELVPHNCGCPDLKDSRVHYMSGRKDGLSYTVGTVAEYNCSYAGSPFTRICTQRGWTGIDRVCDIPLTTLPPEKTCARLHDVTFSRISYSRPSKSSEFPLDTVAKYTCHNESFSYTRVCNEDGWTNHEPICSCPPHAKTKLPNGVINYENANEKYDRFPLKTTATFYCHTSTGMQEIGKLTCTRNLSGKTEWTGKPPIIQNCRAKTETIHSTYKATDSPSHHSDGRTLVIVSGTTGGILGTLIVLVVIVSCQRRLHYHRMRRARLRHRQDQDAFAAFITYHRDVRLMLPSYDEAVNQQEQGRPPTFEEAVGPHYEEPSLPPDHTPEVESPPASNSPDTPTSSASPVSSEARNSPENGSDTAPLMTSFDGQSSVSPSEDSRFLRSLRTLFGGRTFRTDAIYCRFVPQEPESESSRNTEQGSGDSVEDTEFGEALARAGLC